MVAMSRALNLDSIECFEQTNRFFKKKPKNTGKLLSSLTKRLLSGLLNGNSIPQNFVSRNDASRSDER